MPITYSSFSSSFHFLPARKKTTKRRKREGKNNQNRKTIKRKEITAMGADDVSDEISGRERFLLKIKLVILSPQLG
jgi:hypothetical protein